MKTAKNALDYPALPNNVWVIWSANQYRWPDARRELHYLSAAKRDIMKGFALFTPEYEQAATFTDEASALAWLSGNNEKRTRPYDVNVTTVAVLKASLGYERAV